MKHLQLLRNSLSEIKESNNQFIIELNKYIAQFKIEEDKDFTHEERFQLYKIAMLYFDEKQEGISKLIDSLAHILQEDECVNEINIFLGRIIKDSYQNPNKLRVDILLEKLNLFEVDVLRNLENFAPPVYLRNSPYELWLYVLEKIIENQFHLSSENCVKLLQSEEFLRIVVHCFLTIDLYNKLLATSEKKSDNSKFKKLIELTKKNIELILQQKDHTEILGLLKDYLKENGLYSDNAILKCSCLMFVVYANNNINQFIRNYDPDFEDIDELFKIQEFLYHLIYEKYYYTTHEHHAEFVTEVIKVGYFPNEISDLIAQYAFFKPNKLAKNNLIVTHFLDESKEYYQAVEKYKNEIENVGSYISIIVETILNSLGLQNKMKSILLSGSEDDDFCLELAKGWPSSYVRYVVVTLPTMKNYLGVPQHATLGIIDMFSKTIECIDSLGMIRDSGIWHIERAFKYLKYANELRLSRGYEFKHINDFYQLSDQLRDFSVIVPSQNCPAQQIDSRTCVLHQAGNILGIILKKENLCFPINYPERVRKFIESLYIDIKKGEGIAPRSPEMLHNLAGVLYLAANILHEQRVELDTERLVQKKL